MRLTLVKNSYRQAHELLKARPAIKEEIEHGLLSPDLSPPALSRVNFNDLLKQWLVRGGWQHHPTLFYEPVNPLDKIEFIKERVGLEIGFRHSSLIGHNLIKFQFSSAHFQDPIDVGVLITTTRNFQKWIRGDHHHNWSGSMNFEKVERYLRHFTATITMPIYLIGIDIA